MLFRETLYFFRLGLRQAQPPLLSLSRPGPEKARWGSRNEKANENVDFEQLKTNDDEMLFVVDGVQNNFKELQDAFDRL